MSYPICFHISFEIKLFHFISWISLINFSCLTCHFSEMSLTDETHTSSPSWFRIPREIFRFASDRDNCWIANNAGLSEHQNSRARA